MKEIAEKYLSHLYKIFKVEPKYFKYSDGDDFPPLHLLTYEDIPELGMMTGISSGMSMVEPVDKCNIRKELLISVFSSDPSWALAMADIAYQHRRTWRFEPGDVVRHNGKVSEESEMTSFLIWHQGVIREDHEIICHGEWHTKIMGLFPIHDDERELIAKHGPDWLFELVDDPCDVKRKSVAHKFKQIH